MNGNIWKSQSFLYNELVTWRKSSVSEFKRIKSADILSSPKADVKAMNHTPRSINEVLRSNKKDSSIKKKDKNRIKCLVRHFEDPTNLKSPQVKSKRVKKSISITTLRMIRI